MSSVVNDFQNFIERMGNFSEEFIAVLQKYKDKNAVTYFDIENHSFKSFTYKDITEHFEICCNIISKNVTQRHCCIGLLMCHNPYIPGFVMSLQKLGHCFIFLNVDDDLKQKYLLRQLNIKWLIAASNQNEGFSLVSHIVSEFALWKYILDEDNLDSFKDISYVICTSGTTGTNKIVKVQNYCIYSNVKSIQGILKVTANDIVYFGTNLTFDPSVIELFLTLITGATLLILPRKIHLNPRRLFNQLFLETKIGMLQMSPSVFQRFSLEEIQYILQKSSLKILCLGGENFPKNILSLSRKNDLQIFNLYGITEVSCWASFYEIKNEDETVYLGTAFADTLLEVRDESGNFIQEGIGEMFIGSAKRFCVVDDEILFSDKNKTVFRATGDIVEVCNNTFKYIGRKNALIKRYGNRIILSNIENKIYKETQLSNICIWNEEESKLLLFFIIQNVDFAQKTKIIDKLRVKLLHCLKKECFPDFIDILKTIPLTSNGKLDRLALYKLFLSTRQPQLFSNFLEIFNELLLRYFGVNLIKTDVTLVEMGANSIVLLQFFEELRLHCNNEINNDFLSMLFECNIDECRKFLSTKYLSRAKKRKFLEQKESTTKIKLSSNNILCKIIWKYDMKACVDCSPILIDKQQQQLIAVGSFAHIFAIIDASSGLKISEIVLPDTIEASCSVSTCKNFVYVGCFDFTMYCIKIDDASIVWKFTTGDRLKSTPSFCRNSKAIVFGSYDKYLYCLNALHGTLIWKSNLDNIINTNTVVVKERIFIATIIGKCFCVTESDGSVLWECDTQSPVMGSPCLMELKGSCCICWANVNGAVNCFSCDDGKLMWKYQTSSQIFSPLLHSNSHIIFGCHNNFLYVLKIENNTTVSLQCKISLDAPISSASCILNNETIVTPTTTGSVFLINLKNHEIESHINLGGQIFSSPYVCDNRIFIGCRDNYLYCLEVEINKSK